MLASGRATIAPCDLEDLLEAVNDATGFDARDFARPILRRRLRRLMVAESVASVSALRDRLTTDNEALQRAIRALSPRSTSMFRGAVFLRALRAMVVPHLRTYPSISVWHVGCGTGEESFALAIVLREEGILEKTQIYATEMSETAIASARHGVYPAAAISTEVKRYREAGGTATLNEYYALEERGGVMRAVMRPDVRGHITFAEHNCVSDAAFHEFQLVVCRDVMLDFNPELQERVFQLIDESLCPFGMLAIGTGETLRLHPDRARYDEVSGGGRIFRRSR